MNRLNTIANLRTIQGKVAELHCLVIDELTRLATEPDAENQPHGPKVPGFEDEVEWGPEATFWRVPDTRDLGRLVRVCRTLNESASGAPWRQLIDILLDPGISYVVHEHGSQVEYPYAWIKKEPAAPAPWDPDAPIALPIHIDVETAPEITHTAHVIVADGEVSVVAEPVEPAPAPEPESKPADHPKQYRLLGGDEEIQDGDWVNSKTNDQSLEPLAPGWIRSPLRGKVAEHAGLNFAREIEPEAPAAEEPKEEPQPEPVVEESEYREVTADDVGQVVEVRDWYKDPWRKLELIALLPADKRQRFIASTDDEDRWCSFLFARVKKGS